MSGADVEVGASSDDGEETQRWNVRGWLICLAALAVGATAGALISLGASGFFSQSATEDRSAPAKLPKLAKGLVALDEVYDSIKTGVVRHQVWTVAWRNCPNNGFNQPCGTDADPGPVFHGVRSKAITINGMTPGPVVDADLGDTVRVEVINNMNSPITVHFHGITQFGTPYMDGTPLTNCPIPPGGNFTYEFIAHPAGTSFYHSHLVTQHESGLSGAVNIRDPKDIFKLREKRASLSDGPEHTALFKDWWSMPGQALYYFWQQNSIGGCLTFGNPNLVGGFNPATYSYGNKSTFWAVMGDALLFESIVVNGKGVYDYKSTQITVKTKGLSTKSQFCPGQMDPPTCQVCYEPGVGSKPCAESSADSLCGEPEIFEVEEGKSSIIHLVSDAQLYMLQVCIDGHKMTVVGTDMMPVEPYETQCLIMGPGERYDVSVNANQAPGDYKLRFITLEFGAFLDSLPWIANCEGRAQGPCSLDATPKKTWGKPTPGLPHQGFALLRYKGSPLAAPKDVEAPDYWLSAQTLGCSSDPSAFFPQRCHHIRELKSIPETLNAYYGPAASGPDFIPPAALEPTFEFSAQVSFLPDGVPRTQNKALLSRMQIYPKEKGFPFAWTDDPPGWQEDTPIAYTMPAQPTLSLSDEEREKIYSKRIIWRRPDMSNPPELFPNFPRGWSQIESGTKTISVKYGDVVRIFMNATMPFGAGAAMPHPMHLHGHKMAVLAIGKWNEPYDPKKLNTKNPVYKDVVPLYSDSWFVVQFVAENPGVWFFHCHVNIHLGSGMGMAIDSGGDVPFARRTPEEANMCSGSPTGAR